MNKNFTYNVKLSNEVNKICISFGDLYIDEFDDKLHCSECVLTAKCNLQKHSYKFADRKLRCHKFSSMDHIKNILENPERITFTIDIIPNKEFLPESPTKSVVLSYKHDFLRESLECPVCSQYMVDHIYTCKRGHIICSKCVERVCIVLPEGKHKTLTIKEKCDILDRLNRNETFSSLASEYGVGRSTIYDVKKKHEKIKKFVSTTDCGPGKRQTLKKAEHPEVEEALYMWFLQERNRHAPISGPMLAMKAKFFYKEITKKDDFVASKGWLERFKSRHGIRLMTITGEKLSNDATCIEPL
ncbi:hypothetical protein JTB14_003722 [Gonioctena quinquepunctata]|nr:hypothetical protein JTB14_003722 [Gonioctena quinquepunctata]